MDWIDTIENLNTLGKYPFATMIHWTICGFCGYVFQGATRLEQVAKAVFVFLGWMAYEIVEYLIEADRADVDIANGLFGLYLGMLLQWIVTLWRLRRMRRQGGGLPPGRGLLDRID